METRRQRPGDTGNGPCPGHRVASRHTTDRALRLRDGITVDTEPVLEVARARVARKDLLAKGGLHVELALSWRRERGRDGKNGGVTCGRSAEALPANRRRRGAGRAAKARKATGARGPARPSGKLSSPEVRPSSEPSVTSPLFKPFTSLPVTELFLMSLPDSDESFTFLPVTLIAA